jgi:hypothetical protein
VRVERLDGIRQTSGKQRGKVGELEGAPEKGTRKGGERVEI